MSKNLISKLSQLYSIKISTFLGKQYTDDMVSILSGIHFSKTLRASAHTKRVVLKIKENSSWSKAGTVQVENFFVFREICPSVFFETNVY